MVNKTKDYGPKPQDDPYFNYKQSLFPDRFIWDFLCMVYVWKIKYYVRLFDNNAVYIWQMRSQKVQEVPPSGKSVRERKKEKLPSHFIQSLFKKLTKRGMWACVDHLEPVE